MALKSCSKIDYCLILNPQLIDCRLSLELILRWTEKLKMTLHPHSVTMVSQQRPCINLTVFSAFISTWIKVIGRDRLEPCLITLYYMGCLLGLTLRKYSVHCCSANNFSKRTCCKDWSKCSPVDVCPLCSLL